MITGRFPHALAEAARSERDTRAERYPRLVAERKLDAEHATVDYQAWCAIADWLETGKFLSYAGGQDGDTWIDWTLLESAAERAAAKLGDKASQEPGDGVRARHARLICIHQAVKRQREWLEETNRQLRELGGNGRLLAAGVGA